MSIGHYLRLTPLLFILLLSTDKMIEISLEPLWLPLYFLRYIFEVSKLVKPFHFLVKCNRYITIKLQILIFQTLSYCFCDYNLDIHPYKISLQELLYYSSSNYQILNSPSLGPTSKMGTETQKLQSFLSFFNI